MNGACLKERLVCYATISCNDENYKPKLYKGSCEASFKKRSSNHKKSFNVQTWYQAINGILELKKEVTNILGDKRNMQLL